VEACVKLKGDTDASIIDGVKNSTDLNFPHFFRQLSLKMFGRQQWTLFADFLLTK
jgi:hypothetical protein